MVTEPSSVFSFPPSGSKINHNISWTKSYLLTLTVTLARCPISIWEKLFRRHMTRRLLLNMKRGSAWCRGLLSSRERSQCLCLNRKKAWGKHRLILRHLKHRLRSNHKFLQDLEWILKKKILEFRQNKKLITLRFSVISLRDKIPMK